MRVLAGMAAAMALEIIGCFADIHEPVESATGRGVGGAAGGRGATSTTSTTGMVGAGGGEPSGCPGTAGPQMVDVGSFCIDATEVTNAQYAAFVQANVPPQSVRANPPWCVWNTDYAPP